MMGKLRKLLPLAIAFMLVFAAVGLSWRTTASAEGETAAAESENVFVGTQEPAGVLFAMGRESQANQLLHPKTVGQVELAPTDYIAIRYQVLEKNPDTTGVNFKLHLNALNNLIYKGTPTDIYYYTTDGQVQTAQYVSGDYLPRKGVGFDGYMFVPCIALQENLTVTDAWLHLSNEQYQSTVWYSVSRVRISSDATLTQILEAGTSFDTVLSGDDISVDTFVDFSDVTEQNLSQKAELVGGWSVPVVAEISAYGSSSALFVEKAAGQSGTVAPQQLTGAAAGSYFSVRFAVTQGELSLGLIINGTDAQSAGLVTFGGENVASAQQGFRGYAVFVCPEGVSDVTSVVLAISGGSAARAVLYSVQTFTPDGDTADAVGLAGGTVAQTLIADMTGIPEEELASRVTIMGVSAQSKVIKNIDGAQLLGNSANALSVQVGSAGEATQTSVTIKLDVDEYFDANAYDALAVKVIGRTQSISFGVTLTDDDGDVFTLSAQETMTVSFLTDSGEKEGMTVTGANVILNTNQAGTLNLLFDRFSCEQKNGNGLMNTITQISFVYNIAENAGDSMVIVRMALVDGLNETVVPVTDLRDYTYTEDTSGTADVNLADVSKGGKVTAESGIALDINTLYAACALSFDEDCAVIESEITMDGIVYTIAVNPGYVLERAAFSGDGTLTQTENGYMLSDVTREGVVTIEFSTITYTITYVLNGGTNSSNNPTEYDVETSRITLVSPRRDGYTFAGWYTTEDFSGEAVTSIARGMVGDITLYAKWEAREQEKSGCGSVISAAGGAVAALIVLPAACALIFIRKRKKQ